MIVFLCRLAALLLALMTMVTMAVANEVEIWSENITSAWLDDHVAVRRASRPHPSPRLSRTQVWASGIARSDMQAFMPTDSDRAVGAKMQPFQDYNFLVGTELIHGGGSSFLSSKTSWEAFLKQDWQRLGLTFGLSTAGFVDSLQNGYSQSISGSVDIPLDVSLHTWSTELRLSPSLNVDAMNGAISTGLLSEIVGQTRLTSPADRFRSDLNVRLGYGLSPSAQPVASAKLELRIAPNL